MEEWIETNEGTRISRLANINGAASISISNNCTIGPGCTLNGHNNFCGDPVIRLGKNVSLMENCLIDPSRSTGTDEKPSPLVIGNYSSIGKRSVIRLSLIGNRVHVGEDCNLGDNSVVNDCCIIENSVTIPARSVIPPYSKVRQSSPDTFVVEQLSAAYRRVLEVESHYLTYLI